MDLSNYEQIAALIRKLSKGMSLDDQDDFIQDVYLKLVKSRLKYASKSMVRQAVRQAQIDAYRMKKRRPVIVYSTDMVESSPDDTYRPDKEDK